jgi:cell division protein FtsA
MTGLNRSQTPKTRPVSQKRTAMVASLDIGTSKIACMIARLKPSPPNEALRGRTHAVELIGYSQIQSRGAKAGAVVDPGECEQAVRHAVALAERMAKVRVESVLLSVSAGRLQGQLVEAASNIKGGAVTPADISRITSAGMRHATADGRTVLHALPVTYALDGVKGVRDPRGMVARQFGVDMNVITSDATVAKNLMLVVERCHLNVEAMAAAPYVAGLVEMGAGTTTIAIYSGGRIVHASGFALGGQHVTMDLARGISACIADAERIKTLYGTVLTGGSDARELMSVPTAGDHERDVPQIVSRATIANIIRHRAEEIFEMVRDRLADSPLAAEPKASVILSGGASQLTGTLDLATRILGRQVRIGRPLGFSRLPNEAKSASFAVPTGLLVYPQYAHLEHVEPRHTRQLKTGTDGYFGKVGRWLREGF